MTSEKQVTIEQANDKGISNEQFEVITDFMERAPYVSELEVLEAVCSVKGSLVQYAEVLKSLPKANDSEFEFSIGVEKEGSFAKFVSLNTQELNDEVKSELDKISSEMGMKNGGSLQFNQYVNSTSWDEMILSSGNLDWTICVTVNNVMVEVPISVLDVEHDEIEEKELVAPTYVSENSSFDIDSISEPEDLKEVAISLLKNSNIAAKNWIEDTCMDISNEITDAFQVESEEEGTTILATIGSNNKSMELCPKTGMIVNTLAATREMIVSGGEPRALSASFNVSLAEESESKWSLINAVSGINEVASALKIGFTGNKLMTNDGGKVHTNNRVSVLGDSKLLMSSNFKNKGDLIFILGESKDCISSSAYLSDFCNVASSPAPFYDLDKEIQLYGTVKNVIKDNLINAAKSISKGGTYMALTEMGMIDELGFDIVTDSEVREDAFLFGEGHGRVLVTVNEDQEDDFIEHLMKSGTQFTLLGHVTKGKMVIDDVHFGFINEAKDIYTHAIENA